MSGDRSDSCDFVQPFQIEAPGIRGRLVRLSGSLNALFDAVAYPPQVAAMLAEAFVLAATLGSGLKFDGVFSLQIHGDGPIGLIVADLTSAGDLRGYARYDERRLTEVERGAIKGPVPRYLGAGRMVFTVDQGPETERYQGITALEGATIAECAHSHLRHSEQLESAIILCSEFGRESESRKPSRLAGALMLQRLPTRGAMEVDAEENWRRSVVLMGTVTRHELVDSSMSPAQLLYRVFHEDGVRMFSARPLRHKCRCSRARVESTLSSFPAPEVAELIEDGVIRVRCEFCATKYTFSGNEVARLALRQ